MSKKKSIIIKINCFLFAFSYNISYNKKVKYTEAYRSGHNGPDSKSGNGQPFVGSNPTASARQKSILMDFVIKLTVGFERVGIVNL